MRQPSRSLLAEIAQAQERAEVELLAELLAEEVVAAAISTQGQKLRGHPTTAKAANPNPVVYLYRSSQNQSQSGSSSSSSSRYSTNQTSPRDLAAAGLRRDYRYSGRGRYTRRHTRSSSKRARGRGRGRGRGGATRCQPLPLFGTLVVTGLGILLLVLLLPLQQATQITNQGITTVVPKPEPSSSNSNSNSSSQQAQAQAQTPKGSPYGLAKKYVITQEYGCTSWTIEERVSLSECSTGRKHQGIDLAGLVSFGPLYATMRGKVIAAGMMNDGYGIRVELENSEYRIRYAHLSVVSVRMGQIVEVGQELGQEGTTGASTGPHLHYQIWQAGTGRIINPRPYLPLS